MEKQQRTFAETKRQFFEKTGTIVKPLAKQPKGKREKMQIANIRNETADSTRDPVAIKRIIREDYKQVYTHKFHKLNEMEQFLKKYKLLPNAKQII